MLSTAYLGLTFFIVFVEKVRKRKTVFDFLTFFHLIFCLMYSIPGFILAINLGGKGIEKNSFFEFNINNAQLLLAIFIGYFTILLGFYSYSAKKYAKKITIKWHSEKTIFRITAFLLIFACLSVQVYALQFGGVLNAVSQSTFIRTSVEKGGVFVFFKHFMFLSFCASYLIYASIFLRKRKNPKLILYLVFIISVICTVVGVTITGGRAHLIIYFLTFYLVDIIVRRKIPWLATFTLIVPSILFILYGKAFFFSLSGINDGFSRVQELFLAALESQSESSGGFDDLIDNFSYQIYSLKAALSIDYPQRLFIDWYYGIISFLPERLLNIELPETISALNTTYIVGTNDFTIPTGMFAFGIYSFYWPGLIVVCFVYGWIGSFIETVCYNHLFQTYWMPFIYIMSAQIWIDFFTSGDPGIFLFADFGFLLSIFILLIFGSKIYFGKKNNHLKNKI
ncbi:MAG: oligosaccharide repeat unit polymerase [Rivularia sp. T60_A2020_040]|nr:oligosaccharide repeat unit polymerase [Rivularia sp. T60_A2020_040]